MQRQPHLKGSVSAKADPFPEAMTDIHPMRLVGQREPRILTFAIVPLRICTIVACLFPNDWKKIWQEV
jgi:hypothetical protein